LKLFKVKAQLPPDASFHIVRIGEAAKVHPEVRKLALFDELLRHNIDL
jgi:hypothetical protein